MKKFTVLLFAALATMCGMQMSAAPGKAPARSSIYSNLPDGYQRLGNTSLYYSVTSRQAAGMGNKTGYSLVGKIGNSYYSSTYEAGDDYEGMFYSEYHPGAGFIAAFQVNDGEANYLNAASGTTANGVRMTSRIEAQGEVAARITYTLTNNNPNEAVTVNVGVYGDIMIGDNDNAPLERLNTKSGLTYGIKMKYADTENTPLLCALFGEHLTGVTPADDYWFGFFSSNWHANEIVGNYSSTIYPTNSNWPASNSQYYMQENGSYDSGLGFCWKNREIPAGESIELSYLISVGEIDFEEPIIPDPDPEPGEDIFTYDIEAFDCDAWNDLSADHPIHVWGHYEHPYGQAGYLEYQVDDENGWHSMGELVSAEDYEFNFNISFNEGRTTDHKIAVRFNDGLDNYTELPGLSWTDVRSIPVNGLDTRVYNGEPQVYDVTYGEHSETIGENGDYVVPGTYYFTFEGDFDANTIGVSVTPFIIDKAQPIVNIQLPEDADYDGQAHNAVVTVVQGGDATVTYEHQGTGDIYSDAVEVGVYMVIVTVEETDYYYGGTFTDGTFEIRSKGTAVDEIMAAGQDNGAWYTIDGRRVAAPTQRGIYIHNGKKYIVK